MKNYCAIHNWLRENYGKADHCNNINCDGSSIRYDWAKIKSKEHDYKVENYTQLCRKCHMRYDWDLDTIDLIETFVPSVPLTELEKLDSILYNKIKQGFKITRLFIKNYKNAL